MKVLSTSRLVFPIDAGFEVRRGGGLSRQRSGDAGQSRLGQVLLEHSLGATFRPRALYAVRELPKTQSGKIVRRLIRCKYMGEPLGDTSTVQNPAALDQIING